MAPPLKSQIQTTFKLHGFSLRHEAAKHLEALLAPLASSSSSSSGETEEWTDKIIEVLQKRNLDSAIVDKDLLVAVVKECSKEEAGDAEENVFNVIDAFEVPRFTYCEERKKYLTDKSLNKSEPKIYADASSKADLFKFRYQMLLQRTSRHDLFTPVVPGGTVEPNKKKFQLKNIEYLLGSSHKRSDLIILGMLTQVQHGKYSLEDPTGAVVLDLSDAKFHTGLYTESCFVLVEGWYEDNVFHVAAMGFPPAETSEATRAYFGNANFFGGPLEICAKKSSKLQQIEKDQADAMLVFLSDVWLDRANVMEKLAKLFAGYSSMPPTCFVFMGNFLSAPYGSEQAKILKDHLKALADIIVEHPELVENSEFIFVPGPTDPGFANIFPRPALPKCLTEDFSKRVPTARFVSNPCRVQYCTQEIVLFREDIVTKLCRNCIYFPESGDIPSHFAKTLICQGHLAPLPMHICPVYWDFDRSMYLYPLPDLIVVGDKFDPFSAEVTKCKIVNPGSFGKNDFSFKTYVPKTKDVEDSQVPDEI